MTLLALSDFEMQPHINVKGGLRPYGCKRGFASIIRLIESLTYECKKVSEALSDSKISFIKSKQIVECFANPYMRFLGFFRFGDAASYQCKRWFETICMQKRFGKYHQIDIVIIL